MIHSTVPPGQVNRATVPPTVSEFWHVLSGRGEIWRRDESGEEVTFLTPGVSIDIPVGTAFQYRCNGAEALRFLCITMPPSPGNAEATQIEGPSCHSASRPGVFRDRILRQISVAGSGPPSHVDPLRVLKPRHTPSRNPHTARLERSTCSATCFPCFDRITSSRSRSERRARQIRQTRHHSSRNRRQADSSQPAGNSKPAGRRTPRAKARRAQIHHGVSRNTTVSARSSRWTSVTW